MTVRSWRGVPSPRTVPILLPELARRYRTRPSPATAPEPLAPTARVARSNQNQALSALLFLYRHVLQVDIGWMDGIERAKRPTRLPVVWQRIFPASRDYRDSQRSELRRHHRRQVPEGGVNG